MEEQDQYHGSLVAFEGPADTVSTQLRLLPRSPQVLILPSIQTYMKGGDDSRFSARAYVRNVHRAARTRHNIAMSFLRGFCANNKRIVFLSGGTAGAISQCISAIGEHQAPGEFLGPESIYRSISEDGVKGLDEAKYSDQRTLRRLNSENDVEDGHWGNEEIEDPCTKAMRAADALYKETDFLQPLQPIDYSIRKRPRSFSLPMYGHADGIGEPSTFFVFGSPPNQETQLDMDPDSDEPNNYSQPAVKALSRVYPMAAAPDGSRRASLLHRPPSCVGEPYRPHSAEDLPTGRLYSPTSDALLSPPATPDGVIYGEARLVQMRASRNNKPLRNYRSLDDLGLHERSRQHDSSINADHVPKEVESSDNPESKSRHWSIFEDPYSSNNLIHLPQARFVKAHTTTIRKSPTFERRLPKPARESYVHRGTDAANFEDESCALDELYQPVLPLTEDLVIHFVGETHDQILGSVIESFKSGHVPISPCTPLPSLDGPTSPYPSNAMTADLSNLKDQAWLPRVAEYPYAERPEEYDPFMVRDCDVRTSDLAIRTLSPPLSAVPMYTRQLPTPAQTPPPVMDKMDTRFHDFSTSGQENAVVIQNALRSVLEVYFPPQQDGGYHHLGFPLLPNIGNLWRHVGAHGSKLSERNADLVLAIGCQKGVKKDFLPALMSQIEKLGAKWNGTTRSGRLDMRYLIANAMQSFTAQPLAHQTHNNPFENPYLLACLIIPHLETYLTAHSSIRFLLLEYPAEHLATVLALQKLLGTSIFKVAGIINSDVTSPCSDVCSSPSSSKSSRSGTMFSNEDTNSLDSINLRSSQFPENSSTKAHRRKYSFSKANYLLTCSATEPEIAVFISAILKLLVQVDPFYAPEHSPSKGRPWTARSKGTTTTTTAPLPKLVSRFAVQDSSSNPPAYTHTPVPRSVTGASPPMSPCYANSSDDDGCRTPRAAALFSSAPQPPLPPPRSTSLSPSSTSIKSQGRSITSHIRWPRSGSISQRQVPKAAVVGDEAASMYAMSVAEDGEFYDDEERRLMPMYMRQKESSKGNNSRKALKWLGLA